MWIKICGLTNLSDAQAAVQAGADALGFIFVRSSPRYLPAHSPKWQAWLTSSLVVSGDTIPRVLVLSAPDELPAEWHLFTAVQWIVPAGVEPTADTLRWLPDVPLWAAFRFPPELSADDALQVLERWSPYAERFVLDTYHPQRLGGTGATHDWRRAAAICQRAPKPVLLAGGLTPENVAQAVRMAQPAGVDVSSGVEAAVGRKDPAKLRAFIANARMAREVGVE